MRISIHMPAYNAQATIASALESLLRQRDAGVLDIIVIDDGSTDRTREIVLTLAAMAPEIRLISTAHGGISRARNEALCAMTPDTDLVGFLDADDLSPAGRLARDVEVFESDPSIDLIYSRIRYFDHEDAERLAPSASSHTVDARNVNLAAGLFRRQLIEQVGPFDEGLAQAEDLDYVLRIFDRRPHYLLSDHLGVFYRKHLGGVSENRRQSQHETMRALFRAHRRGGNPILPQGVITITADHVAIMRSWAR